MSLYVMVLLTFWCVDIYDPGLLQNMACALPLSHTYKPHLQAMVN